MRLTWRRYWRDQEKRQDISDEIAYFIKGRCEMVKSEKTYEEKLQDIRNKRDKGIKQISNSRIVLQESSEAFSGKTTFNMILQNITEFDSALVQAIHLIEELMGKR